MEEPLNYRSYLLRLWQVREGAGLAWRATLEDVKTGERRGFTSPEDLMAYLHQVAVHKPPQNPEHEEDP